MSDIDRTYTSPTAGYFARLADQTDAVIARIERRFGEVRRLRIAPTESLAVRNLRRGAPVSALTRYEQLDRMRHALLPESHLDHVKSLYQARLELKTSQALYATGQRGTRAIQLALNARSRFEKAGLATEAEQAKALLSRLRRKTR